MRGSLAARFDEDGDGDVDLGEFQRSCFEVRAVQVEHMKLTLG